MPAINGLVDVEHALKVEASRIAWTLYESNKSMEICTIKKWFIQKTFYLSDLRPAFELLFGPQPSA